MRDVSKIQPFCLSKSHSSPPVVHIHFSWFSGLNCFIKILNRAYFEI